MISGLGLAYLPLHAVRLELAAGELAMLDVAGFPLRRRWYALHRRGRRLSNAAQGFLDYLRTESQAALAASTARPDGPADRRGPPARLNGRRGGSARAASGAA